MAKKTITNKQYYNNNKKIRELLEQDFEQLISYNGKRHIWNESGEILMSPTRFISFFRELNMAKIPFQRLEEAKTIEMLHNLIKNNGQDFNLSKEQLELVEKLK